MSSLLLRLAFAAAGHVVRERHLQDSVDLDGSGRMVEVWSGPPIESDPTRVARGEGRRELLIDYEPIAGRVCEERYGGDTQKPPLHAIVYDYHPESVAPWSDAIRLQESVPGQSGLVDTFTTTYRRDAFGRPIEERRNDGSVLTKLYDRSGDVIRASTGAGTQAATTFDGRGLPLKVVRPNGRGFTLYAYDLDGALLREATRTATADLWETAYAYDNTGRPKTVTYADSTSETLTYNSDSTVRTRQTRDGLVVTFDYDAANRLKKAAPTGTATTIQGYSRRYDTLDCLVGPTPLWRTEPKTYTGNNKSPW